MRKIELIFGYKIGAVDERVRKDKRVPQNKLN